MFMGRAYLWPETVTLGRLIIYAGLVLSGMALINYLLEWITEKVLTNQNVYRDYLALNCPITLVWHVLTMSFPVPGTPLLEPDPGGGSPQGRDCSPTQFFEGVLAIRRTVICYNL